MGLGCYVGVNVVNGVFLDDEGNFDVIDVIVVIVVYCYLWSESVCINFIFFLLDVDIVEGMVGLCIYDVYSMCINYIYNIIKLLLVGLEYIYVKCEIVDGFDGDMSCV